MTVTLLASIMQVAHILSGSEFLVFQKFLERFKFAGVLNFKSKIVVPKNGVNELVRGATDNKGKSKLKISTIYLFFLGANHSKRARASSPPFDEG